VAGHQALVALADHPWFELSMVAASSFSAGRRLRERLGEQGDDGAALLTTLPTSVTDLRLGDAEQPDVDGLDLVFSMLPSRRASANSPSRAGRSKRASAARSTHSPIPMARTTMPPSTARAPLVTGLRSRRFAAPWPRATSRCECGE
jgi:hypothetical protein